MSNSNLPADVRKPQKARFSVAITTAEYQTLIKNTLQDPARVTRFVGAITSAVAVNAALQECDASTILAGSLLGESLGLSPSPQLGHYYLVPFDCKVKGPDGKTLWLLDERGEPIKKNGKLVPVTVKKAQFVLGYKGYVQLALRSGYYADLDVMEIKEGEYLGKDPATGKPRFRFVEDDFERDNLQTIGYMAYFEYLNGFRKVLYWSREKMMNHADTYSAAFSAAAYKKLLAGEIPNQDMWRYSSFWYKNFDDMAMKTLLRQLISRWGIMSTELQQAFVQDASIADIGKNKEIDITPEGDFDPSPNLLPNPLDNTQPEELAAPEQVSLDEL